MTIDALFTLNTLVLSDHQPDRADAIYLFAHVQDNQRSVIEAGGRLAARLNTPLMICGSPEAALYDGSHAWKSELQHRHNIGNILEAPPLQPLHTGTEALSLVREAKARGWTSVQIVSTPWHQLRAFLSVVHAVRREYPQLCVYNHPGDTQNWHEIAIYNQSGYTDKRHTFFIQELERIQKYIAQQDLPDLHDALAYLEQRG